MIARTTISLLLLLTTLTGYSQDSDVSTLLTPKDGRWIQKRGFLISTYDWSNEEINLNLELAAKYRKQSHRFIGYGAAAYAIGSTVGFASLLTDAFTGNRRPSATTVIGTTVGSPDL